MEDLKDLEFLAEKSKEFIDKQISAYRQKHSNAGSVIAIIALFIPFFLNGLDESFLIIKLISVIPVALFIYSVKLFLDVLKSKSLDQGFSVDKLDELANYNNYEKVLLYEIGANRSSFNDNKKITNQANNCFNLGIKLTLCSVILSIGILLFNNFFKPTKEDKIQKIEIIKSTNMSTDNQSNNNGGSNVTSTVPTNTTATPVREIPVVPQSDRTNLNEHILDMQTKLDTGRQGE